MRESLFALLGLAGALIVWRQVRDAVCQPNHVPAGANVAGLRDTRGAAAATASDVYFWPALGRFEFDVGVTTQAQPVLRALVEQTAGCGQGTKLSATLHPGQARKGVGEPVEIRVDGVRVGFLADGDATRFQRRLAFESRAGQVSCCDARISTSDHPRRADKHNYSIALDLKPFRH